MKEWTSTSALKVLEMKVPIDLQTQPSVKRIQQNVSPLRAMVSGEVAISVGVGQAIGYPTMLEDLSLVKLWNVPQESNITVDLIAQK